MRPILLFFLTLVFQSAKAQQTVLSVYFEKNSSALSAEQLAKLESFNQQLNLKEIKILGMEAYCDTSGTVEYNHRLAKNRLNRVISILGLPSNPKFQPIGEDLGQSGQPYMAEKQRRVDILYEKQTAKNQVATSTNSQATVVVDKKEELATILTSKETELTINFSFEFVSGTAVLVDPNDPELNALTTFLKDNPRVKAHIRGHVCCSDNQLISEQRAEAIYQYLTYSGVSKEQLSFKGYSNSIPLVTPEVTEADKQKNRRVDIIFRK